MFGKCAQVMWAETVITDEEGVLTEPPSAAGTSSSPQSRVYFNSPEKRIIPDDRHGETWMARHVAGVGGRWANTRKLTALEGTVTCLCLVSICIFANP